MKKSTVYILVGVGVLALVGIGIFAMRRRGQAAPGAAPAPPTSPVQEIRDTVSSLVKPTPEAAQLKRETQSQRLQNRRLRGATRQAKLIKKGKIDPRDLQTLQSIQAFAGGESFFD